MRTLTSISLIAMFLFACGGSSTPSVTPGQVGTPVTQTPNVSPDGPFPIALDRRAHVGDQFAVDVHVVSETTMVMTQGGAPVRENSQKQDVHLVGQVEVLEVDQQGLTTRRRVTVERFTANDPSNDEGPVPLVPAGGVIFFSAQPRVVALGAPNSPAPREVAEAFTTLMQHGIINTIDNAMLGSATPRSVGDQWPAHDIAAVFASQGVTVREGEGSARIISHETIDGTPALVVEGALRLNINMSPNPALVPQNELMTLDYRFAVPVELTGQRLRQETRVAADAAYLDPSNGQGMTIQVRTLSQSQLRPL